MTQPPSLSEVAQRFIERAASTDDILQAYYRDPRVKRLITAASRQFRQSDDFIEELHQDLALLLVEKFIFELSDADKIYNVLHVAAVFKARRKSMKASEDSLDEILERTGDTDHSTSAVMVDGSQIYAAIDDRIDREKAVEEFNRRLMRLNEGGLDMLIDIGVNRMPAMNFSPSVIKQVVRRPPRVKKPANYGKPSKEGEELNEIRQKMGYTLPEFAQVLNCPKGTLSSYLYGSVQNVPGKLLEEARGLAEQADPSVALAIQKFSARSMTEIVKTWIDALGTFVDDKSADNTLATALDVDRATVWRWRTRNMRPDLRKLEEYDKQITKVVRKAAKRTRSASTLN